MSLGTDVATAFDQGARSSLTALGHWWPGLGLAPCWLWEQSYQLENARLSECSRLY